MKVLHGEKVENGGGGLPWKWPWDPRGTFSPHMCFSLVCWKEQKTDNWLT